MTVGPAWADLKEHLMSGLTSIERSEISLLSPNSDPYRCDSPAAIAAASWIADIYHSDNWPDRPIHPRGVHYLLVSIGGLIRPNGDRYLNDEASYKWLKGSALSAARWLALIPFAAISDERNDDPIVLRVKAAAVGHGIHHLSPIAVPEPEDIFPQAMVAGDGGGHHPQPRMPTRIILMGEKTSLRPVFETVARRKQADIYLASGNISNTLMNALAESIEGDGRPALILFVGDADPQGHNMPLEVARKLQALADMSYPNIRFAVKRVGLTVAQALALDLPPVPMKGTEPRAGAWFDRFGVHHQYELDALATLRPEVLEQWLEHEIAPHYDRSLGRRLNDAVLEYEEREQAHLNEALALDPELRDRVDAAVAELQSTRDEVEEALALIDEPTPFVPPKAETETTFEHIEDVLIHSDVDWHEATRQMVADKIRAK